MTCNWVIGNIVFYIYNSIRMNNILIIYIKAFICTINYIIVNISNYFRVVGIDKYCFAIRICFYDIVVDIKLSIPLKQAK